MSGLMRLFFRLVLGAAMFAPAAANAQLQKLFTFPGGPADNPYATLRGAVPISGVIRVGPYLYGMTLYGGLHGGVIPQACGSAGCGTVYLLNPSTGAQKILHEFTGKLDGGMPRGELVFSGGAFYGTTSTGGMASGAPSVGTVFKLMPPAAGQKTWTLTTIHKFTGGSDGASPAAGLIADKNGLLYGTTFSGFAGCGCGTVFKLDPTSGVLTTLYTFTGAADGGFPVAGLLLGKGGLLYGTTNLGRGQQIDGCVPVAFCGTVFRLNPNTGVLTTLFTFPDVIVSNSHSYPYGRYPNAGLVADSNGALYSTAFGGGPQNFGTVFKLAPPVAGHKWTATVLHNFCKDFNCVGDDEGYNPVAGLVFDKTGMLYGTAYAGGTPASWAGTVFKLDPTTQVLTTLYAFPVVSNPNPPSTTTHPYGVYPTAGLTIHYLAGGSFVLYGTTSAGGGSTTDGCNGFGYDGCGTVFELTP